MKKIFALAMSIFLAFSVVGCAVIEDEGPGANPYHLKTVKEGYLTVVTSPDYAPYEFYTLDENGDHQLAGFDMALAQYIADYLDLTLEVIPMDFKGIIGEMSTNCADLAIAGLSPDPERQIAMDFTDIYYEGKQALITTKAMASKIPDLAASNQADLSIGAQTGSIQMELAQTFSKDADIISLAKVTDIIAELVNGSLDAAYVEWDVALAYQANYPELQIVCEAPYNAEGNVIGVAKGNTDLMKYVNEALHQCVDDGTFTQYLLTALEQATGEVFIYVEGEGIVPNE